jgi:hypothetical protein
MFMEEVINKNEALPSGEQGLSVLERAEKAVIEINAGIAKLERLKSENEQIASRIALSGRSEAGFTPQPQAPLSDIEYSKKFMNGEINPFA